MNAAGNTSNACGECETISPQMLDVLVLKDGRIVAVMESRLAVYDDEKAFEAGTPRGILEL